MLVAFQTKQSMGNVAEGKKKGGAPLYRAYLTNSNVLNCANIHDPENQLQFLALIKLKKTRKK